MLFFSNLKHKYIFIDQCWVTNMDLNVYKTIIFDCDGVILNSNPIKTQAFYNAAITYGQEAAEKLIAYHVKYGGKSRNKKFDYFIHSIIGREPKPGELEVLLNKFAQEVKKALLQCEVAHGLERLQDTTKNSCWMVASGGNQEELREVFKARGIEHYFDAGIFGSPDDKDQILKRELNNGRIKLPALFLGDSYYDYEAATRAEHDFIFISGWSDFEGGKEYFIAEEIPVVGSLAELL